MTTHEQIYDTIIQWDEGGGKRSRRELARHIEALYAGAAPAPQAQQEPICKECGDTGSIYAVSGEGPFDCYACNRKVAPAPQAQQARSY